MPRSRMMMDRAGRRMRRMRDRGMDYPMDGNYPYMQRSGEKMHHEDMGYDYADMRGRRRNARGQYMADRGYEHEMMDGHYGAEGKTYYPIEAMGRFNGYWGMPEEDYGRYDMRGRGGRRDYGYYGEDYGDYGETLTKEELEHWKKKLMKEVEEKDKHFFETPAIEQKARQMGVQMKDYKPEELAVVSLMLYTDYCKTLKKYVGSNMDIYIDLAKDWLSDPDSEMKGSERLAVYHDEIIMGGEDD